MTKPEHITRFTAEELDELLHRGESQTDWARIDAMTENELAAAIDREDEGEFDLSVVEDGIPCPTRQLMVRLDVDVVEWFKAQGADYQTHMNAVLRSFVAARKKRESSTTSRR